MKKAMRKKTIVAYLALLLPIIAVCTRDIVLEKLSKRLSITKISAESATMPSCNGNLCNTITSFDIDPKLIQQRAKIAVGTFGAELDSFIRVNGKSIDPILSEEGLHPTWTQFRVWHLDAKVDKTQVLLIQVVCVSPSGTHKIGLPNNSIYIGTSKALEILSFVYSLYSIHSYFLLALGIILIGLLLYSSATINGSISVPELIKRTGTFALASILFSAVLDELFISIGVPILIIPNLAQLLWGPILFLAVFKPGRLRASLIGLWVLRIGCSVFVWKYRDFFFYNSYRWAVFLSIFVSAIEVYKNPKTRFAIPYLILASWDFLCLENIITVKSGVYLSPLGFFGLYVSAYMENIEAVIQHHKYWYEHRTLTSQLQTLRHSGSITQDQWHTLLEDFGRKMSTATRAETIGICYLGFDSPLIFSLRRGLMRKFSDGQLPPVFARVVQTKESLWWVTDKELAAFFPSPSIRRNDVYESDRAVVLPILVGGEAYGAVALTDFHDIDNIMLAEDRRHQVESMITSFVDLISAQLVMKKEVSSGSTQKLANEIVQKFSKESSFTQSKEAALQLFLNSLSRSCPCSAMYFEFDKKTERLHLISTINIDSHQSKQWGDIPFRARLTNKISPFAISINERRGVFVENIQTFFNFLTPQSVDVLTLSGTRAFVCAPVLFGDEVLGLVCALDLQGYPILTSDLIASLDVPLKYLAYHLEQIRKNVVIKSQEKVLSRFADPELLELLTNSNDLEDIVVGEATLCAILIQDLRGSTAAARREEPKNLARKLAQVYQTAAQIAREYNASFDKGNGDGTITTLPLLENGNGMALSMALTMLEEVENRARNLMGIDSSLVVLHRGTPFRGIMGNTWRIAWDTCGSDINDAFAIEKVAKTLPGIVLAISSQILLNESKHVQNAILSVKSGAIEVSGIIGEVFLFDTEAVRALKDKLISTTFKVA